MPPREPAYEPSQLDLWSDDAPSHAAPAPLLAPATFRHPRANREALLHGEVVGYEFRRGRRRTIGFSIAAEGLVVSAPRWVSNGEIESALQEKARWIVKKLQEQDERARKIAAQRIDWRDGTSIPFLGETVIVVLDPRSTGAVLHTAEDTLPGVPRLTLHVGLPQHALPEQIRETVQSWLQRQARRVFEERCRHFAQRLGVRWTRLALSSAATRWGSASADGAIRLHWRLIHFALPTIDYVVAHELAHLRVMDHSPRFWDVVRSVIPDVERLRDGLRDEVLPPFD
jgi:predicted metal-dependent hydrolase